MASPKVVSAKPVHLEDRAKKSSKRELWATVSYYYPQYTLKDAAQLSVRDIKLLLKVATTQKSIDYLNLLQIASAPHTEKGKGVKTLTNEYRKQIK